MDNSNDQGSPFSVSSTALPPPPRVPSFVPRTVRAGRASALSLVAVNPSPSQTAATIPALRLVGQVEPPTMPPPSIPPTGSTPIRRAA